MGQTVSWSSPSLVSNDYISLGVKQFGYEAQNLPQSSAKVMHQVTQKLPTHLQGAVFNLVQEQLFLLLSPLLPQLI